MSTLFTCMKHINLNSKHSFSDLWLPQSNFVCSQGLIRMMNIYQDSGHSFALTLKQQWRQKKKKEKKTGLGIRDLSLPWNYPEQTDRIIRYYTQWLWNFVHDDHFWKPHNGKPFTESSWGQREKYQMHHFLILVLLSTWPNKELNDLWKIWPTGSTKC